MKNNAIVFLATGIVVLAAGMARSEGAQHITAEQKANAIRMHREVFGGYVTKPDPGNGHIAIVNLQKRVDGKEIKVAVRTLERFLPLKYEIADKADPTAAMSVYLKDAEEQATALTVSPEEFYAAVNVAALARENPAGDVLAARTRKEIIRAVAYVCGAAGSQYPGTLLGPVRSPKALDAFREEGLPLDALVRMEVFAKAIGVRPVRKVYYTIACEEGWAPAPTNKFQQAIWDKTISEKEQGPANRKEIRK